MPLSVFSTLRILHQDVAMSPKDMICTLSAPPRPPVHSAPVLTATIVWAPPTAGELQTYRQARSLFFNLFLVSGTIFFGKTKLLNNFSFNS